MAKVEEIFVSLFPQARAKIIISKRKCRKSKQRKKKLETYSATCKRLFEVYKQHET
jgi:uncharacterized protein YdeI (YjbR/CyaY-like superfamily)